MRVSMFVASEEATSGVNGGDEREVGQVGAAAVRVVEEGHVASLERDYRSLQERMWGIGR